MIYEENPDQNPLIEVMEERARDLPRAVAERQRIAEKDIFDGESVF